MAETTIKSINDSYLNFDAQEPPFRDGGLAPPIVEPSENFFEPHQSLGCGRHALNNLLGGVNFIKEYTPKLDISNISQLPPPPVALQTICRYLREKLQVTNPSDTCPDNEYYDQSVLEAGMRLFGYTSNDRAVYIITPSTDRVPRKRRTNDAIIKDIVSLEDTSNIGFVVHFPGHWTTIKKLRDGRFRHINSLNPDNQIEGKLAEIIQHADLHNADVMIPYYRDDVHPTTRDYVASYKTPAPAGFTIWFKGTDEALRGELDRYRLPPNHTFMKADAMGIINGKSAYVVTSNNAPEPPAASAAAPAPAPAPPPAPPTASAAALAPAPAPAPELPEGYRRPRHDFKPLLPGVAEVNRETNNENNNTPKPQFYTYDSKIIKVLSRLGDTITYQVLSDENRWGSPETNNIPESALTPIECDPPIQHGGRRKRIRRTVRAKTKARPTRRLRKRT